MMEMTEELELPDISPDPEAFGEPEEDAAPDAADDETAGQEDTDETLSGDDEPGQKPGLEDVETGGSGTDGEITGDGMETGGAGSEQEDGGGQTEESTETDGEEVPPGNISVSGNILVLPEGYELTPETFGFSGGEETDTAEGLSPEQFTQLSEQLEQVEEAVAVQTDVLYGGTAVISLILGSVLGVLLIHGFRLRRV